MFEIELLFRFSKTINSKISSVASLCVTGLRSQRSSQGKNGVRAKIDEDGGGVAS